MSPDSQIGIVGCGNLGEAIVTGLVASGHPADHVFASHPRAERRDHLKVAYGIRVTPRNEEVLRECDLTLIAVKPQMLDVVLPPLGAAASGKLVVSLAAGTPAKRFVESLPGARIVRAMPNQPAAVRAGVTGLWAGAEVGSEDRAAVTRVFEAVGAAVWVPKEELFHALTALSACGPGFLYAIADALADGGVAAGLSRPIARLLAAHTMAGAGRTLVAMPDEHPASLKDKVASPGGTTIHGLAAMEKAGVRSGVIEAVRAAARRSVEMAGEPVKVKKQRKKTARRPPPKTRKRGK